MKLKWISLFIFLWVLFLLLYRVTICFSYLPELSNGESNNIWKAINVANGKPMYTDPEELPLEVFQYTPISQYPIIAIAKICNKETANYVYQITVFGRIYELLANCLLTFLIFLITKKWLFRLNVYAILTSIVCFSLLTNPAFTIRPDATLLLLILGAIWCYLKYEDSNKLIWNLLTSFLIVSCFFTKQDGILIAAPFAFRLFILKEWRKLLTLTGITVGVLSILIAISPMIFGPFFFKCIIQGLKNTSSLIQLISVFDRAYGFYGFHFVIGIIISIYFLTKHPKKKIAFFSILTLFYLVVAIVTSSKSGSWVNYYTPFIIFSSITILYFFYNYLITKNLKSEFIIFSIAISISFFFIFKQVYVYTSPHLKLNNGKKNYYTCFNNIKHIKSKLKIINQDNILIINQLERNFLPSNSVMVNTEYYNYASYSYKEYKRKRNKNINFIIYKEEEKNSIEYLLYFFNVDINNYKKKYFKRYIILEKKTT